MHHYLSEYLFLLSGKISTANRKDRMKRISLWSGPRNVSTALMYSFARRSDTRVVDEPLYACYLETTGADHPGREEVLASQSSDAGEVIDEVILGRYDKPVLFIKNMAHHLTGIDKRFMEEMINPFLIRDPREMLPSLIKTIPDPSLRDTAYKIQFELFEYTVTELGQSPIVIDSRKLLKNPEKMLNQVCARIGIPFKPAMLHWEKGPIPEDGIWAKHWYGSVHDSTGFKPYRPKDEPVPDRLSNLLEKCLYYYNQMEAHSINV